MTTSGYRLPGLSLKGFAELNVDDSHYKSELWPQLDQVVDVILNAKNDESRCVSFEENYSTVYKIVCNGYGTLLYEDLIHKKIDKYIEMLDESLHMSKGRNPTEYIENFGEALNHFNKSMHSIMSIFVYLNRSVLSCRLEELVYGRLNELLISKHVTSVLETLERAEVHPFAVEPSTCYNIIKTLYKVDQDYGKLNPKIFQRFIPGYNGCTNVDQLQQLSQEAKQMSEHLSSSSSFPSRSVQKRALDGDAETGSLMDDT